MWVHAGGANLIVDCGIDPDHAASSSGQGSGAVSLRAHGAAAIVIATVATIMTVVAAQFRI